MSQCIHPGCPIVRHLPSLKLVNRRDEGRFAIGAYRCRKWKSVSWAQLASLVDDTHSVVKACEVNAGVQVLKAHDATIATEGSESASKQ